MLATQDLENCITLIFVYKLREQQRSQAFDKGSDCRGIKNLHDPNCEQVSIVHVMLWLRHQQMKMDLEE